MRLISADHAHGRPGEIQGPLVTANSRWPIMNIGQAEPHEALGSTQVGRSNRQTVIIDGGRAVPRLRKSTPQRAWLTGFVPSRGGCRVRANVIGGVEDPEVGVALLKTLPGMMSELRRIASATNSVAVPKSRGNA